MIRRATEKDLDRVNDLLRQVLAVHHKGRPDLFRAVGKKYTDEELLAIFRDDLRPVFVWEDKTVLGYAFCQFEDRQNSLAMTAHRSLYIDDLCVDESARGRGIGKELFRHCLSFAKENACHNVTLNVWSCNESARCFYEKMGMQVQKIGMETVL